MEAANRDTQQQFAKESARINRQIVVMQVVGLFVAIATVAVSAYFQNR